MRPHLIVGTIVLALALIGGALGQDRRASSNTPKLNLAQTEFDFGLVKTGETVAHTFVLKNEGTGNLIVKQGAPC